MQFQSFQLPTPKRQTAFVLHLLLGLCALVAVGCSGPGSLNGGGDDSRAARSSDAYSGGATNDTAGGPSVQGALTETERELYEGLNAYRVTQGLPEIPLSYSLTVVARSHVQDLIDHGDSTLAGSCNLHSWSNHGNWSGCCYTSDHSQSQCMWDKPRELTNYPGNGYEISSAGRTSASATLEGWKNSAGHNAVIVNEGIWESSDWQAIGIGIDGGYAHVWFGREADPDSF